MSALAEFAEKVTPNEARYNATRTHALALEATFFDVSARYVGGHKSPRAFPCRIRFWRPPGGMLVCGLLSRDGILAFGCVDGDRTGTWTPSPKFAKAAEEEIAAGAGWRRREELDAAGLPALEAA